MYLKYLIDPRYIYLQKIASYPKNPLLIFPENFMFVGQSFYLQIDPTINQKKMKAASQVLFIHARASFIPRRL